MKVKDYRADFYTFTGKASDLNRQLALAGIAIIWLFKKDTIPGMSIPREMLWPGALIVASLATDIIHYCAASLIWRSVYRRLEDAGKDDEDDTTHSVWLERPLWALFCLKIALVLAAYALILKYFLAAILFR